MDVISRQTYMGLMRHTEVGNKSYSWKDFKADVIEKHPVHNENDIDFPVLESYGHVDIDMLFVHFTLV